MLELQHFLIDDNGTPVEIVVESPTLPEINDSNVINERPGAKGSTDQVLLKMADIQSQIQAYAKFAIEAFQHLGTAEVEEINLKFGIKLGGKTGVIFTEGSAEGSMEISVKCKFPTNKS